MVMSSILPKISYRIRMFFNKTMAINIVKAFPLFAPSSSGSYTAIASLTMSSVNKSFPLLNSLIQTIGGPDQIHPMDVNKVFGDNPSNLLNADRLKSLCNSYGTEKPTPAYLLYAGILGDGSEAKNIFEIGLGTNNTKVVSNMGADGHPGASLRAFRDYCANADVIGADIDSEVLFEETRIQTIQIDQTNFSEMLSKVVNLNIEFNLFIDDGLHSPEANLASLITGLKVVSKNGWVVIEDIGAQAFDLWPVVAKLLPTNYSSYILHSTGKGYLFAVQRTI